MTGIHHIQATNVYAWIRNYLKQLNITQNAICLHIFPVRTLSYGGAVSNEYTLHQILLQPHIQPADPALA